MDILDTKFSFPVKVTKVSGTDEETVISLEKSLGEVITRDDFFLVNKAKVLKYNGCKKLADVAGLRISKERPPQFVSSPSDNNKQQHIWLLCVESKVDSNTFQFAEGEASTLNTGKLTKTKEGAMKYSEVDSVDAKFRSRMAYKRAFSRAVLDLLGLYEFYTEEDAKEFKEAGEAASTGNSVDYSKI